MLKQKSQSKVYNIVAPIHPSKEEVINAQKGLSYSGARYQRQNHFARKADSRIGF
jgi:hypothetical protein